MGIVVCVVKKVVHRVAHIIETYVKARNETRRGDHQAIPYGYDEGSMILVVIHMSAKRSLIG